MNALLSNKTLRGIVVGLAAGAVLGATVGWVYTTTAQEDAEANRAGATDYLKLGIALLTIARQVGDFALRA